MAFKIKFNSETKKHTLESMHLARRVSDTPYCLARLAIILEFPGTSHDILNRAAGKLSRDFRGTEECKGGYEREYTNDFVYGFLLALSED